MKILPCLKSMAGGEKVKFKLHKNVLGTASILGLVLILGSAGAIECNNIPMGQGAVQIVTGLAVFARAAHRGGFMR